MQGQYMHTALQEAKKSYEADEVPVGAVIVDSGTGHIIAQSGNNMHNIFDPTAHAEINVIKEACSIKKTNRLVNCDLYVTLEPCPMCAQAISFARIKRLYFGAYDIKGGGVEHGPKIYGSSSCHHKPEVYGGIEEESCVRLLQDFFKNKR